LNLSTDDQPGARYRQASDLTAPQQKERMKNNRRMLLQRSVMATLIGWAALSAHGAYGQSAFPAIQRQALAVKAPERQFLLAATQAGQRIVAVGERGLILLSDDEGKTWRQSSHVPVSITLTAVCFVNDQQGWAVGHGGTILSTMDAGDSWVMQANGTDLAKSAMQVAQGLGSTLPDRDRALQSAQRLLSDGPDKPLLDVYFQNAKRGWVVGAYNLFFETHDGGKTWTSVRHLIDNPKEMHLYTVRSAGSDIYILGEQGQMHRSSDGGRSFQALKSPYAGSWFTLALTQDGSLVAGGLRGNLFRSINRGDSWEQVAGAPPISFVAAAPNSAQDVLVANQAGHVFALGSDSRLRLLYQSPHPALTGLLPLKSGNLLVTGASGVTSIPADQLKKGN